MNKKINIYHIIMIIINFILLGYIAILNVSFDDEISRVINHMARNLFLSLFTGTIIWVVMGIVFSFVQIKRSVKLSTELIFYFIGIAMIPISVVLSYFFAAVLGVEGKSKIAISLTVPYIISLGVFTIKVIVDSIIYKKINKANND